MEKNDPNQFRFVEEGEDEIKMTMKDIIKRHGISLNEKNKEQEGEALSYIGLSYHKLGKYKKALDYHQQHLELSEQTENSRGKRRANCNIGCVYKIMGDLPMALYYFERAYNISKERGDRKAQARICNNMANIYEMLMDVDKAIELHNERYDLATDLEDLHGQGKACVSLGAMYLLKEDLNQSLSFYEKLLDILRAKLSTYPYLCFNKIVLRIGYSLVDFFMAILYIACLSFPRYSMPVDIAIVKYPS